MKKTKLSAFILFCVLSYFNSSAQCSLACYADYTLSLDASGNGTLTAYDVLDSYGPDCGTLVMDPSSFDCSDIGSPVPYTVTDLSSGNFCWGNIHVEYFVGTMICYADVDVTLDPLGVETLTADMLLLDPPYDCIPGLIINPPTVSCADIGTPVLVTITDPVSGNSCWSTVNVSFNVGTMSCYGDLDVQLGASGSLTLSAEDILFDPPAECIPGLIISPSFLDCSNKGSTVPVFVTDPVSGNSCWTNVNVENPRPSSCEIIAPSSVICGESGVIFSVNVIGGHGPFDYLWEIKGNSNGWSITSGQGTDAITMDVGIKKINLEVTVTDVCGKKRTDKIKVECEASPSINGVALMSEALNRSKEIDITVEVYPNPANQVLNIRYPKNESINSNQFYVVNQLGQRQAISLENQDGRNLIAMNIQDIRPGIYWLIIKDSNGESIIKKFIKY